MANTKQVKAVDPLINGFSGGSFTSGDGSNLFVTNHPTIAGTVSNTLSTQADLNETSLEDSLIQISKFTDERGLKIAARGNKMIVPSELQFTDVPNGMKYFERSPIRTAMEGDFDTGNVRYKARERYRFGVSDYRGIFGVSGA